MIIERLLRAIGPSSGRSESTLHGEARPSEDLAIRNLAKRRGGQLVADPDARTAAAHQLGRAERRQPDDLEFPDVERSWCHEADPQR
jgi:hypothetical protein